MRLLVATRRGQGDHPGDYCFAIEGELVTPLIPDCTSPRRCGCRRGFDGLQSDRATTTALAVDLADVTPARLMALLEDAAERARIVAGDGQVPTAADQFDEIVRVAAGVPVGTVVRRDGRRYAIDTGAEAGAA